MNQEKKAMPILLVILGLILLDQLTKHLALSHLSFHKPHGVFSMLNFTLTMNSGVSFGIFSGLGNLGRIIFSGLALVMGSLFAWWSIMHSQPLQRYGFCLLSAGALGNVIDRIRHGAVVDFIDFHVNQWHPFIFNMADAFINIGVGFIALDMLLNVSRKKD